MRTQDQRLAKTVQTMENWVFVGIWMVWAAMYSVGTAQNEPLPAGATKQQSSELNSVQPIQIARLDSGVHAARGVDHMKMVKVQGGSFEMGGEVDKPIHTVTVSDFYIDKYEVTVAQYKKFCEATRRAMPDPPQFGWSDDNPIIGLTWNEAQEYATSAGKRLPTEAEWEYAARGGKLSKGYRYSGSDDLDKVAWYDANSQKMTHPVGMKAPNELGILDMSGNAAEWCSDMYGGNYYSRSPKENPAGPKSGSDRVVRGGSFMGDLYDCQVSFRRSALPNRGSMRNGFRCASSK